MYVTAVVHGPLELYDSVHMCVQRVVAAHVDIFTGVISGSALADNDISSECFLSAIEFYAESFTFTVPAVIG